MWSKAFYLVFFCEIIFVLFDQMTLLLGFFNFMRWDKD